VGREPERKDRCGHPRRVGDRLEAGCCGEGRSGFAGAHSVTRGADIKRELTPLLNIANILCLGGRNHAKDAEDGRDAQRSRALKQRRRVDKLAPERERAPHTRVSTVVMMMGINDIGWPVEGAITARREPSCTRSTSRSLTGRTCAASRGKAVSSII
jgi:hypothetical protein